MLPLALALGCSSTTPPQGTTASSSGSWFSNPFASKPANPYESSAKAEIDGLSLSKTNKTGADVYVYTAKMQEQKGNLTGAKEQYEKGLTIEPKSVELLVEYAHMEDRAGHFEDAAKLYRRAIAINAKNATPHNDLGLCLARMNKLPEATTELQKAVELEPKKPLYRNNLATVLIQQNRVDDAVAQLSQTNTPAVAHYNAAFLLQRRGETAMATRYMTQAAQLDPTLVAAQSWLRENAPQVAQAAGPRLPEFTAQAQPQYANPVGQAQYAPQPTYSAPAQQPAYQPPVYQPQSYQPSEPAPQYRAAPPANGPTYPSFTPSARMQNAHDADVMQASYTDADIPQAAPQGVPTPRY